MYTAVNKNKKFMKKLTSFTKMYCKRTYKLDVVKDFQQKFFANGFGF